MLEQIRLVPVVTIDDASRAGDLMAALEHTGIPCAEITLRTPAAAEAIRVAAAIPGVTIGAGTVTGTDQVDMAHDAGARFIVSPGYSPAIVQRARELDLAVFPGVATASELQWALADGVRYVKFFPAAELGGLRVLNALSVPFPEMSFMPTGGIGTNDAAGYLEHPSVFAVGGSWMVPRAAIAEGRFDEVRALASSAAKIARNAA